MLVLLSREGAIEGDESGILSVLVIRMHANHPRSIFLSYVLLTDGSFTSIENTSGSRALT